MSTDTIADIFEKPGVPYSTSADLYSTTTIGAALPPVETAAVVNPPMGGGAPSSDPLAITFNAGNPIPTPPSLTVDVPITPINVGSYFSGGPPPKVYSVFSGTLPPGLALNSGTGVVSGTPTAPGVGGGVVFRGSDNAGNNANSNSVVFTVVAAGDPSWANVSLLLPFNEANGVQVFVDASNQHNVMLTSGSVPPPTASNLQSKFYPTSCRMSQANNGNVLTTPNSTPLLAATGDFSIEGWVYWTDRTGAQILYNRGNATGLFSYQVWKDTSHVLGFRGFDASSLVYACADTTPVVNGQWYFVQARRSGNSFQLAVNGVQVGVTNTFAGTLYNLAAVTCVGNYQNTSFNPVIGYMQDWRFTKGVARAFAVPTASFPTS